MSPFAKIDGLYFDPSDEPDDFFFNLSKDFEEWIKKDKNVKYIHCRFTNPRDYYNMLSKMEDFANDNIKVYGTSRENQYELIVNESSDIDDNTKPSTIGLQKKRKRRNSNSEVIEDNPNTDSEETQLDQIDNDLEELK